MAKTQDLKRRIRSIRNTMQLTKAMKMVAAAKLRRAQERMLSARPYAERTRRVLQALASKADAETHPLLSPRGDQRIEAVVVTADRGLCGGFNAGAIRAAIQFFKDHPGRDISVNAIGKKGRDALRGHKRVAEWVDVFRHVEYSKAQEIAAGLMKRYMDSEVDRIFLVYNEFKSAIQATPVVKQLLPIATDAFDAGDDGEASGDYIYEPSAQALFAALLPHYVENQVFQAMIESAAAEHGARMTAMDAATKNAGELIENLTLTMNRVRQASITTEIIEVVSGAEALG
jgi:F-type H+-transporting ATPase subunit gamma